MYHQYSQNYGLVLGGGGGGEKTPFFTPPPRFEKSDFVDIVVKRKIFLRLFKTKKLEKWYIFETNKLPPWETHICSLPIGHDKNDKRKMLCKLDESSFCRGKIINFVFFCFLMWGKKSCCFVTPNVRILSNVW